ncbi:MAG TPA: LysM peptidoglycan-binding domain-containing protein [Bellilinea sp.]|nr:LysM peptidoglycan-binding domain-containing protein [Bellilinea sp.]
MMKKTSIRLFLALFICSASLWTVIQPAKAQDGNTVSAYDLIALINSERVAYGFPALNANSILMSTAQSTAEIMAANSMGWHIGDVSGRVMAAGYGGGSTAWATENFAIGPMTIDEIAYIWSDASHQIPVVNGNYQDVGAGIATSPSGAVYYVLQAAYTSGGSYTAPTRAAGSSSGAGTAEPTYDATAAMAQYVSPVTLATPGDDGIIRHEVLYGQSLWSIAIAYNIKILDILNANGLSADEQTVYAGQKLVIPGTKSVQGNQPSATLGVTSTPAPTDSSSDSAASTIEPQNAPTEEGPHAAYTVQVNLRFSGGKTATVTPQPSQTAGQPVDQAALAGGNNPPWIALVLGGVFLAGLALILFGIFSKRTSA